VHYWRGVNVDFVAGIGDGLKRNSLAWIALRFSASDSPCALLIEDCLRSGELLSLQA
jgi:hypothetical protein